MSVLEIIRQVRRHLEESGRLSYRMLRREFDLDDDALAEVIEELVDVQRVAKREENALAWSGNAVPTRASPESSPSLFLSWALGVLASAHGGIGQIDEAFGRLTEAFELVEQNGERFFEAELFRVKGELSLKSPTRRETPEACFRLAIAVAHRQSAKFWELRATTSLARLLGEQAKKEEARALLAEIYGWFTEGLETPDLKDAEALLEELS